MFQVGILAKRVIAEQTQCLSNIDESRTRGLDIELCAQSLTFVAHPHCLGTSSNLVSRMVSRYLTIG